MACYDYGRSAPRSIRVLERFAQRAPVRHDD